MNKAIQQAIEFAREGKNQEAYELIEQELRLHPDNGLAWAIRAQLTDNREDRLEFLNQALELAPSVLAHAWIRREIEQAEAASTDATRWSTPETLDPFPGDPVPSPHALDIAFLEDDTDHSMQTQAMTVAEQKPRWRGCLNLLIAVVVLVIVALAASVFLVPALRQMIPFLNLPIGAGPAVVAEEPAAAEPVTEVTEVGKESDATGIPEPTQPPAELSPTPITSETNLGLIPVAASWTLVSPVTEQYDRFGEFMAIDGQTVVAGQIANGPTQGAFIFTRAGQDWEVYSIPIERTDAGFLIGGMAVDSDTAVVGDIITTDVRVYIRDGASWPEQALLLPPPDINAWRFGETAAISGDTIAVGAPIFVPIGESPDVGDIGTVTIYTREGNTWSIQATIYPPEESQESLSFGDRIALDQDTLVVASYDIDNSAVAFIYQRSGSNWDYRTALDAGMFPRDRLGVSLDISGSRVVFGILTDSDEDLSPVIIYEDISQAGDWSEVEQKSVPRPVDTLYAPAASDAPGDIWTTAAIDGDQIVFAGIKYTDDVSTNDRKPGMAYLSRFENGQWILTHEFMISDFNPVFMCWNIGIDGELVAISAEGSEQIGQILIYDLASITTE